MTVVIDRTTPPSAAKSPGPVSAAALARRKADQGGGLYKKRVPIYPKLVHGKWRTIKWAMLIATLAIYYVTPWIRWDRPGALPDQAVLVDFAGRRFYFFFIQLWPQEVYFITGLLVIGALALFLVTALFGRLWCGYACPQTVWTDLFIARRAPVRGRPQRADAARRRADVVQQALAQDRQARRLAGHRLRHRRRVDLLLP